MASTIRFNGGGPVSLIKFSLIQILLSDNDTAWVETLPRWPEQQDFDQLASRLSGKSAYLYCHEYTARRSIDASLPFPVTLYTADRIWTNRQGTSEWTSTAQKWDTLQDATCFLDSNRAVMQIFSSRDGISILDTGFSREAALQRRDCASSDEVSVWDLVPKGSRPVAPLSPPASNDGIDEPDQPGTPASPEDDGLPVIADDKNAVEHDTPLQAMVTGFLGKRKRDGEDDGDTAREVKAEVDEDVQVKQKCLEDERPVRIVRFRRAG